MREIHLGQVRANGQYALTVWVKNPAQVQASDAVQVTGVSDAEAARLTSEWLHAADLDFYLTLQPRAAGPLSVSLSAPCGNSSSGHRDFAPSSSTSRGAQPPPTRPISSLA